MSLREELQREIEETRVAFLQLLDDIPEEAFDLPSDNPAWSVGEVLYHMSPAPRFLWTDAKMITEQSWRLIPIVMPKSLFNWLNKVLTKYGARNLSREFLAQEYEKAHTLTLRALDETAVADFAKQVQYPDWDPLLSGEVTLERLFRYVKVHFDSHEEQIRQIVAGLDNRICTHS